MANNVMSEAERMAIIGRLLDRGFTLERIARACGFTRERARQYVKALVEQGKPCPEDYHQRSANRG